MKGIDIVVKGSVGHLSAFMAQAGNLVVLRDAGEALGDSIYEAQLFVRGKVHSLGVDCVEKPLEEEHKRELRRLLDAAGINGTVDIGEFRRYGSARKLYHFHVENVGHTDDVAGPLDPYAAAQVGNVRRRLRSPKFVAPRPPASMTFAAAAPSASFRTSTTCCFLAPPSAVIRWKAIGKSARPMSPSARALPRIRSS